MSQPTGPACDCGQPAGHQSVRDATDEETAAYRQSLNDHRVGLGFEPFPDDVPAMSHPVTVAVMHCCDHRPEDHAACGDCPTEVTSGV